MTFKMKCFLLMLVLLFIVPSVSAKTYGWVTSNGSYAVIASSNELTNWKPVKVVIISWTRNTQVNITDFYGKVLSCRYYGSVEDRYKFDQRMFAIPHPGIELSITSSNGICKVVAMQFRDKPNSGYN